MQATELGELYALVKSAGPWSLLTAYLIYKDLYKPWRNGKNSKNNLPEFKPAAYVRESDFVGLSQSVRDHAEQNRVDIQEIRERLVRIETLVDPERHQYGHPRE